MATEHAMRLTIAKLVLRVVGTLAGMLGIGTLCIIPFLLNRAIIDRETWMILLAIIPLPFAAYFVFVAYLVWFKFSPCAVRHVCGAVGLYLLTQSVELFGRPDEMWKSLAFLGCPVVVYVGYRVVSARLNRWLFPLSDLGVQL